MSVHHMHGVLRGGHGIPLELRYRWSLAASCMLGPILAQQGEVGA